jgi:hypothetical protein
MPLIALGLWFRVPSPIGIIAMPHDGLIEAISKIIQPEIFSNDHDLPSTGEGEMIGLAQAKTAAREKAQQIVALFEGYLD